MFYSHQLLSKKGALGTIWVAAHSHKNLNKEDVSNTNISSSVDKILLDEVPVVTYRILAYLLLGVVRIYSKKVEYLFSDCNNVLSEVRHFITSKKCDADIEVMCAPYSSITVPERFELDAFDLEIIENLNRDHIKMKEEITLEGKNDGICSPSFHQSFMEEDTSHLGGFSAVHTTCNHNYSMSTKTAEMVASTLHNLRNLDRSMDKFRSNRFSLEDCLPPMLFDEAEERADPGRTFHEDSQTDRVEMNPPRSPIMSGDAGRPGYNAEAFDKEHEDSAHTEFYKLMGMQNEKIQIISPKCPVSLSISIDATPESKVANSPGARTPGLMAVGTPATKEGARVSKKQKCLYDSNEIVIANEYVYKAGLDDPSEGARALKKRKCLFDANQTVITNKVYKAGLDDPSKLVKKRKKTNQMSEKIFFQPLIPGIPINFSLLHEEEQISPVKIETTKTPTKSHDIGPLSYASVDEELSPIEDSEYDESLMTKEEEISLCEGDDKQEKRKNIHELNLEGDDKQEKHHWSTRTRAVARFLHREILTRKKRGEIEVVKLSQVVEGKSKKRNARLFYELLALTTRGFLNVKQNNPYDDISIVETSKLKQSFEADIMA